MENMPLTKKLLSATLCETDEELEENGISGLVTLNDLNNIKMKVLTYPGIGPAKAKKIINEFNKLENIPDEYFVKDEVDYKKVILDYKSIIELPFNYN